MPETRDKGALQTMRQSRAERIDAMLNGMLILAGMLGTVDNVLVHWILGLHRLIEDSPYTLHAEIALVVGAWREYNARRHENAM
jgi:uncharacterized membrane protein